LGGVEKGPGASTGVTGWLRGKLAHPLATGLDLESAEATRVHAQLIREKPFLRRLYGQYYAAYDAAISRATPGGLIIEVGSGGGFYPAIRRDVISLDMRPGADVDVVASALAMPFPAASVSAVLLLNVLHHLPDPRAFFGECTRMLKPGGRVCLIEPYVSVASRRLVKPLHHEPWDETAGWALPESGPMTGANMAMPWIIFFRDRARYDAECADLPIDRIRLHTIGAYLLSGGVSMRSLLPGWLFDPIWAAERLLTPASSTLASMMTIELVRR
jgi:SAM-dependent methyltransferase